jgi:parallel beta-helix repeat protein
VTGFASSGGGMYNESSSPALIGCTFATNSATGNISTGGGMWNYDGSAPTLDNCTFTGNSASYGGGGMYNEESSSPALIGCTFSSNSAELGGGMYNLNDSTPTLTDCNFCGNTTSDTGNRNVQGDIDASSSGNLLLANCNPGDANFDLEINRGDVIYVLGRWKAISVLNADINQDGVVNIGDLVFILINFAGTTDDTPAP